MSKKKIELHRVNLRNELRGLFEEYQANELLYASRFEDDLNDYYSLYGECDPMDWWEDGEDSWEYYRKVVCKKGKHRGSRGSKKGKSKGKKGKGKKSYEVDAFGMDTSFTEIWFYNDINNKYDRLCFQSLAEFDDYCEDMGYYVSPNVGEEIVYNSVSHCCINPLTIGTGRLDILVEESYLDLCYAYEELCSGTIDAFNDNEFETYGGINFMS